MVWAHGEASFGYCCVVKRHTISFYQYIKKVCDKTKRTWMETTRKNRAKLELNVNRFTMR